MSERTAAQATAAILGLGFAVPTGLVLRYHGALAALAVGAGWLVVGIVGALAVGRLIGRSS